MKGLRFYTLLCQDGAGFYSALPVELDEDGATAGFGRSPARATEQLRDYLAWLYQREPHHPEPDLTAAELRLFKVPVRPEYETDDRIYPCKEFIQLPVHCVAGRLASGMLVGALPLLGLRFYYHEPNDLKGLVIRYVQQRLKGLTPGEVAQFLPPPVVQLDQVVIHVRDRSEGALDLEDRYPALCQVAEPLGDRAVRKQFSPAWERTNTVRAVVQKLFHDQTSLLLVGESGVGKTTVLVDAVKEVERLLVKSDAAAAESPRRYWLTSAGRLIAGMKYLGQWEGRFEEVLAELCTIPGVLCVDRLLDLVRLGGFGPGDSIAAFLIPYLQRGEVRVVAEATPAELDACRRLLPGLADLFPIVQVAPLERQQVLALLDAASERHAQNLHIEMGEGVNDRIYHLFRRFVPYQVFPGPAVAFLDDVCTRHAQRSKERPLGPSDVVARFGGRSGLPEWLICDDLPIDRDRLIDTLRCRVIGQEDAVQAVARLVMTFKAGLIDPGRPLGVYLFCGPTGVGKTELARALAHVLFGHGQPEPGVTVARVREERLLRLDMSEYAGYNAVERLLGPPDGEPGLLVRRLRQQPFSMVLLDEIEKASADVFDLLLGALDEGRLTDRYGRTTWFRSSVIIMTSNLGADEQRSLGLVQSDAPRYEDVSRKFFRPEFFNRLDEVVTFQPLGPETIHAITTKELNEIAEREGIRRMGLSLGWTDRLVAHLAHVGFDARYGARPLQRVMERSVVAPLARFLLEHPTLRNAALTADCTDQGAVVIR
jgi:ATP-dependent Clp protease ATP-binding subunit ClpC